MVKGYVAKPGAKKRKKSVSLDSKKSRSGLMFVLPFIIGIAVIYLPIIYDSLKYSFNEVVMQRGGGFTLNFVGWKNYQDALFVDTTYVKTLVSGIQQLVFEIPAIVIFSLFMAVLLNQDMFGRAAFRAIFFIPVILCTGLIDSIDQSSNAIVEYMSSGGVDTGATAGMTEGAAGAAGGAAQVLSAKDLASLFGGMQIGTELLEYVTDIINNIYDIVNRSGVQMLIFLSGLQSISPAIYESCSIDGASAWETFWKITFPMISPMILVNAIYTVIDAFTRESNSVMMYIDEVYSQAKGNVLSSAMAWMYFIVVLLLIGVVALILSSYIFYQKRD